MTPSLRKRHRQVWSVLAVGLPVLFIAAIMVIPDKMPDPLFNNYQPAALPEILKETESGLVTVRHRANRLTGQQQLEVVLKKTQRVPSTLAYLIPSQAAVPEQGAFLGSLSSVGVYRFEVGNYFEKQDESFLLLYDPVKDKILETLKI